MSFYYFYEHISGGTENHFLFFEQSEMKFAFKSIFLIMSCIKQFEFIMLNNIAIEGSRISCMLKRREFTQGIAHANYEKSFNSLS